MAKKKKIINSWPSQKKSDQLFSLKRVYKENLPKLESGNWTTDTKNNLKQHI